MSARTFRKYLLPGFVFQSVVIAGGYGTGREIVEFFLSLGPAAGLLAMLLVSMVIWSVVSAVSFEFARRFRTYEYRSFFRRLLGRGWLSFEVTYIVFLFLVLAVIAAIERTLAAWSMVLYAVYAVLFVWSFVRFGEQISAGLAAYPVQSGWAISGLKYAAYNLATIPVVLFVVRHIETRREAVGAGLLAGVIGILPALLFYLAMVAHYPEILDRPVPANHLLEALGSRGFQVVFQVVLFGTLIETGTGMIHAVNERLAATFVEHGRQLPRLARPATAVMFLLVAGLLARVGLVDLIARGYGTITWAFLVIYVIPILTLGVWILVRREKAPTGHPG